MESRDTLPPAIQPLDDDLRADRTAQRRQLEMQSRLPEKLSDEVSKLHRMFPVREAWYPFAGTLIDLAGLPELRQIVAVE